jgi:hypothetical protein
MSTEGYTYMDMEQWWGGDCEGKAERIGGKEPE